MDSKLFLIIIFKNSAFVVFRNKIIFGSVSMKNSFLFNLLPSKLKSLSYCHAQNHYEDMTVISLLNYGFAPKLGLGHHTYHSEGLSLKMKISAYTRSFIKFYNLKSHLK